MNKIYRCSLEQFNVEDFNTIINARNKEEVLKKYMEHIQQLHTDENTMCIKELKLICKDTVNTISDVVKQKEQIMRKNNLSFNLNSEKGTFAIAKEIESETAVILTVDYSMDNWTYTYPKYLSVITEAYNIQYLDYVSNTGECLNKWNSGYWIEIENDGIKIFEAVLSAIICVHSYIVTNHKMETKTREGILESFVNQIMNY